MVSPYEMERIEKLRIHQEVNQHVKLYLYNPAEHAAQEDQIQLKSSEEDLGVLFRGMIQKIQIHHVQDVHYVEIEAVCNTMQMDLIRNKAQQRWCQK